MKRRTYLFPLMAATALTLTLAACGDDKAKDSQLPADQSSMLPITEQAPMEEITMPEVDTPDAVVIAPIDAENAIAYATAPGARSGAVFVTLSNPNAAAYSLTGARTDRAGIVEIHRNVINDADGTVEMRLVGALEIAPGIKLEMQANDHHIMLIDLTSPLVEGETFDITLEFGSAGELTVPVSIVAAGGAQAPAHDHSSHGDSNDGQTDEFEAPDVQDEPVATDGDATETIIDETVVEEPATDDAPAAE